MIAPLLWLDDCHMIMRARVFHVCAQIYIKNIINFLLFFCRLGIFIYYRLALIIDICVSSAAHIDMIRRDSKGCSPFV